MMKSKNVRTGQTGEIAVKNALIAQGYIVDYRRTDKEGDWLVTCPTTGNQFRIEVKASNRGIDGSFKFCLYRAGKTNANHSDIVALVFYDKKTVEIRFMDVLHVNGIKNLKFRSLPDKYDGKYRSLWHKEFSQVSFLF